MTREEKELKRNELRLFMDDLRKKRSRAEKVFRHYDKKWLEVKFEHEKIDYELALEDERFKKVKVVNHVPEVSKLSIAQILLLAETLGVKVEVKEVNEGV